MQTASSVSGVIVVVLFGGAVACENPSADAERSQPASEKQRSSSSSRDDSSDPDPVETTDSGLELYPPKTVIETPGLTLDSQRWRWRDDSGRAWRVRLERSASARVAPARDGLAEINALTPSGRGPWAAINGGFYRRTDDGSPVPLGLVVSDGETVSEMGPGGGSGVFQITDAGPTIIHRSQWEPGPSQALQSVDRLVAEGSSVVESREPERTSRSAVAITPDHLWLVALAGDRSITETDRDVRLSRTSGNGVPLHVFAEFVLASTDAERALNLDGGVSTQLEVRSGDEHFLVRGARPVINALVVRPAPEP